MFRRATLVLVLLAAGCFVVPACTCGMEGDKPAETVSPQRERGKIPPLPRAPSSLRLRPPTAPQLSAAPSASAVQ